MADDDNQNQPFDPDKEDNSRPDGESTMEGSQPASGSDEANDLDENLDEEGLYPDKDNPNGPPPVGIAEQIEEKNEG